MSDQETSTEAPREPTTEERLQGAERFIARLQDEAVRFAAAVWATHPGDEDRKACELYVESVGCRTPLREVAMSLGLSIRESAKVAVVKPKLMVVGRH